MDLTKENPGYYSDMLKELAKIDNVPSTKRITYKSIEDARQKGKVKFTDMIFSINHTEIHCVKVEMKQNVKTLIFGNFEMPMSEYTKPVSTIVNKSLKDYTAQPQLLKQPYKYCEGGGWYSMASLYLLNGKYYTDAY
jgi:hypothetical protein